MKLRLGCTLKQLLEVYGKKVDVPEILAEEKVRIYGLSLWVYFRIEEPWVDDEVETYFETEVFLQDLKNAKEVWERRLACNDYTLRLKCDGNKEIRLIVYENAKE